MPETEFQITTVRRSLVEGVSVAEALGFPELSALGDSTEDAEARLAKKLRQFVSNPELCPSLEVHRRRLKIKASLAELSLDFTPPRRSPEWQREVAVRFQFVQWSERDDLHHAYVPALNLGLFTPRLEDLKKRVGEHIRRVMAIQHKRLTLKVLEDVQAENDFTLGELSLTSRIPSPLELELTAQEQSKTETVLTKLAEELPPRTTGKREEPPGPAAYETGESLQHLASILSGPRARSVLLVGPAGCGKTALVRELARSRSQHGFAHTAFWTTSGSRLMQGQSGFGMWQERCLKLCRELSKSRGILHLGALNELQEVGRASRGGESVASFLRPWLARGEVLAIAECSPSQLDAIQRTDPQLLQAFVTMDLREPSPDATRRILEQVWSDADGSPATQPKAALDWIQRLHSRYGTYSAIPGRPVRFLRQLLADQFPAKTVGVGDVTRAFTRETGLPEVLLEDTLPLDLLTTREWLCERVIGQPHAVDRVLDVLALIKTRLARPRRPLASLLFIGPTGTGKTELARSLATFVFGDPARLVRFDLSEFNDPISVQRLIGGLGPSPEGLLTARVREQPFLVLLFDEFEKADSSFFDLLLQILGEGRLTDAAGRVADFCNAVIVMTSNLGADSLRRGPSGFGIANADQASEAFADAVRQFLRPEIYNRIDTLVPFAPLNREIVALIAKRQLDLVIRRDGLGRRRVDLKVSPGVTEYLAESGFDPRYGARPLKRKIEQEFVAPLAEALNAYDFTTPLRATVDRFQGRLSVRVSASAVSRKVQEGEGNLGAVVQRITELRRSCMQLLQCREARELENQASLLAVLGRRLGKARWKSPEQLEQLQRLPELRAFIDLLTEYDKSVCQAETHALLALYSQESTPEPIAGLHSLVASLESGFLHQQQQLFRLGFTRPDECVIALFAEPRSELLHFATAYAHLLQYYGNLQEVALFFLPTTKSNAKTTLTRRTPVSIDALFPTEDPNHTTPFTTRLERCLGNPRPQGELAGILLHGKGPSFWPWLMREDGKHLFKGMNSEGTFLVQTMNSGFEEYTPPKTLLPLNSITNFPGSPIRVLSKKSKTAADSILGSVPWETAPLEELLKTLLDERLNKAIRSIGRNDAA